MIVPGRIVILGGYGHFGRRVARALVRDGRHDIHIGGRDRSKAEALAQRLRAEFGTEAAHAAELDLHSERFVRQLGAIAPIVVVNAAGPFQSSDYAVAEAALACRSHYVDLADSREFVTGIDVLDRDARRRDVLLVAGASTLPGISSVVVDELSRDLKHVDSVDTAIVPAGSPTPGIAAIAAVLSYCGKPVRVLDDGSWRDRIGWQDTRRVAFADFERTVACCDVPDLDILPATYPGLRSARFGAGLEAPWQQRAMWLMAELTRRGIVRDWSRIAPLLHRIARRFESRSTGIGAMRIDVTGQTRDGRRCRRTWQLTARRHDGPQVPCAPAILLAAQLASGSTSERGARPCTGMFGIDALAAVLAPYAIDWHFATDTDPHRAEPLDRMSAATI